MWTRARIGEEEVGAIGWVLLPQVGEKLGAPCLNIWSLSVNPEHRRRGIASTMVSAVAMVARENAMPAIYLQVSADNADGVAFWRGLGFGVHHEYTYLAQPSA
jgi:ribosomal protein S18 acetylase RimI-like enzyme